MIAIPAIDIMDGRCVRLLRGDFRQKTTYSADPLDQAKIFEDAGIKCLHLVDLDGAKTGKPQNLQILESIASNTSLMIDYGGGIRQTADVQMALNAGARQVNAGTMLHSNDNTPTALCKAFSAERLIAAVDIRNGYVASHGWQLQTQIPAKDFLELLVGSGWKYVSVTDIGRDGTLAGPDPDFYQPLIKAFPSLAFIGGGGVATTEHLELMSSWGLYGAITGKAIFEGSILPEDLARFSQ